MDIEENFPMELILSPSILCCDLLNLKEEIESISSFSTKEKFNTKLRLHLDIMDGNFVPNISFGQAMIQKIALAFPHLELDLHLMVVDCWKFIQDIIIIPSVKNITIHAEQGIQLTHLHRMVDFIKNKNKFAGIALNPSTNISVLDDCLLELVDLVLIMSVNPGFGGQKFIPLSLNKTTKMHEKFISLGKKNFSIQMDGGIQKSNVECLRDNKVNNFVIGTDLFSVSTEKRQDYLKEVELRFHGVKHE